MAFRGERDASGSRNICRLGRNHACKSRRTKSSRFHKILKRYTRRPSLHHWTVPYSHPMLQSTRAGDGGRVAVHSSSTSLKIPQPREVLIRIRPRVAGFSFGSWHWVDNVAEQWRSPDVGWQQEWSPPFTGGHVNFFVVIKNSCAMHVKRKEYF